ncbi:MAG: hypothetical protein AB7V32_11005 [Candidatus Berkiella sp.]
MSKHAGLFFVTSLLLLLNACASKPSIGEQMILQGKGTEKIGEKWVEGNELITKGNKTVHQGEANVKKGEKLVKKGKAQIHKGKAMIKKGNKMMNKSEHVFQEKFSELPGE